ncbi:MAG: RNA methyltransferase [Spirochaetales bacterium]|nr:RNA methyltransferase [Spirochaetales bacterium]
MNLILFEEDEICRQLDDSSAEIIIDLGDSRAVHILKVLKAGVGSRLDAGIINRKRGKAVIVSISSENMTLTFFPEADPAGLFPLTLLLGLSRPQTVKKVLKEATALGIGRFLLTRTDLGERSYAESSALKPEKLHELFIEGAQQAFCTSIPECRIEVSLESAVRTVLSGGASPRLIALDNYEADVSLSTYWRTPEAQIRPAAETILAVGSERGWTGRERGILRDAGFTLASIGERVLRTETASITGTALCLSGMGML